MLLVPQVSGPSLAAVIVYVSVLRLGKLCRNGESGFFTGFVSCLLMYAGVDLVLVATGVGMLTDIRTRRIPNALTFATCAAALALAAAGGWLLFALAVGMLLGALVVGMVAWSCGWLGGGDVKLIAACAAALQPADVALFVVATAVAGGVFAVVYAAALGRFGQVVRSVAALLRPLVYQGTVSVMPTEPIRLPYGVAIAGGAIVVALSNTVAPFLRFPI